MNLRIVDSGSLANCYILENDSSALVIECGATFKKTAQALDHEVHKIDGCLISHEHKDHCKYFEQFIDRGIKVYATQGTIDGLDWKKESPSKMERLIKVDYREEIMIGKFKVKPFDVRHNVNEPSGFFIHHPDTGNILFAIDTYYIPYIFPNLSHIIIEANYDIDILDENVSNGSVHPLVRNRTLKGHMEIKTLGEMLNANDLSRTKNIVLTHLSDKNSIEADFKKYIEGVTGVPTKVAKKGLIVELQKPN